MHEHPGASPTTPPARPQILALHADKQAIQTVHAEPLELRTMFAIQAPVILDVGPNVNTTHLLENQNEAAIAINPTNPANLFMASVNDARGTGPLDDVDADNDGVIDLPRLLKAGQDRGLVGAYSTDAGATWTSGTLDSDITDEGILPPACCDPSVAFDDFGNLFVTFINRNLDSVLVQMSTDGGHSFTQVGSFSGGVDQPTVATGPGGVWVTFQLDGRLVAAGARVLGPGAIGQFNSIEEIPRSQGGNFGDIVVGPNGAVMVTYQIQRNDPDVVPDDETSFTIDEDGNIVTNDVTGPGEIYVNVDPDGFGPESFGNRHHATHTNIGTFDPIPAQDARTVDAEAALAWDRSGGPFNGRAWLVYTDEGSDEAGPDTEILVRFSDDMGKTWSSPRRASNEDFTSGSQFLPQIALDQSTGNIAVTWHDTREPSQFTTVPNAEATFWGTVGVPTTGEAGVAFADDIKIGVGHSNAKRARAVIEYGDYTGLDFRNNVFYPVWADNSNSTGDNPSGGINSGNALATLDVYTARVTVTPTAPTDPSLQPVGPGSPLKPQFIGRDTITKGKFYKFQIRYQSDNGIDFTSFTDNHPDVLITGPKGYNLFALLQKTKRTKGGVTATYIAPAPGGLWDQGDNGLYSVQIQAGGVRDLAGVSTAAGTIDSFLVSSNVAPQAPAMMPAGAALKAETKDDQNDLLSAVGL
jgi:hypothetical protein